MRFLILFSIFEMLIMNERKRGEFNINIFYSTEIQYTCSQTIQYIKLTKIILQKWIGVEAKLIEFLYFPRRQLIWLRAFSSFYAVFPNTFPGIVNWLVEWSFTPLSTVFNHITANIIYVCHGFQQY